MTIPDHRLVVPVIDPDGRGYVYVAHGADCVLLAEIEVPKWRNAVLFSPEQARRLGMALIEQAARADEDEQEEDS